MNVKLLEKKLIELNQPKYRLNQILKAIFQDNIFDFNEINNIPKDLKQELSKFPIFCFEIEKIFESKDLSTIKALIKLEDSNLIETVLIKNSKDQYTVCISSQVGCPLNCAFCATGQGGFKRNLSSEEITDQVLFWKKYIIKLKTKNKKTKKEDNTNNNYKITNIVYMGMGEPFMNYDNFTNSIKDFINKNLFNFASRSISVSTSFIDTLKMKKFFKEFPQINLAISLHFADDKKRSTYMPVNKKNNLENIKEFLNYYLENYNRKILLEYLMLDGINDSKKDADELIKFIKSVKKNYLLHINIIPYNSTYKDFRTTPFENIIKFENYFKKYNINITLRKSSGEDINAACGQLAGSAFAKVSADKKTK